MKKKDIIIIGAGAAGLTSGIYSARSGLSALIFEQGVVGGQIAGSASIENYTGIPTISGAELAGRMREHALSKGAEIEEYDPIKSLKLGGRDKSVETENETYQCKAVIIAAGSSPKPLPIPSEKKFRGKGIHYCAVCDGAMYQGKTVGVVGGGNSALEEAAYLSGICEKVIIIRRKNSFNAEKELIETVKSKSNIQILYNADLIDVMGKDQVSSALVEYEGERKEIPLSSVFCYIGGIPNSGFLNGDLLLDGNGYIITDEDMASSIEGVFAAGDIRAKKYRQILTAASDGAIAALSAARYLRR